MPQSLLRSLLNPVRQSWLRLTAPRPTLPPPPCKTPYVIVGLFRAASGLGESARLMYRWMKEQGEEVTAVDISSLYKQVELPYETQERTWPETGTVIIHLNAPEMPRVLHHLGQARICNHRIIGYWAWELPAIPPSWNVGFQYVHEVWTCSHFCREAIEPFTKLPVKVVPHRVYVDEANEPVEPIPSLKLPDDALVILTMANADSSLERKNPLAAIEAFRGAFGEDMSKRLILHIGRLRSFPDVERRIGEAVGNSPNIHLLRETLTSAQRNFLYRRCDMVMSLHRSEGYGLVLAEAMLRGKVVIATGWSGNLDFMTEESACLVPSLDMVAVEDSAGIYQNQRWAQPDVEYARRALERLSNDPVERQRVGQRARLRICRG